MTSATPLHQGLTTLSAGQLVYDADADRIDARIPTDDVSNHGASLAQLDNGDVLCCWFAGSEEGAGDLSIVLARLDAGSGAWSEPTVISHLPDRADQNPSLAQLPDGALWLVHSSMETRGVPLEVWQARLSAGEVTGPFAMQQTSTILARTSRDSGHTWSEARPLTDEPGAFCRHPIVVLEDGAWLLGVWFSRDAGGGFGSDASSVLRSVDRGASWTEHHVPGSAGRVHPSLVELGDGQVLAFFRSRQADWIYRSSSTDGGRSWTEPRPTELPNNNASIRAIRLASGRLAIAYNHHQAAVGDGATIWPYERYPVTLALSVDDGITWPYRRHVETGDDYAGAANVGHNRRYEYPALLQDGNGLLHLAYSYGNREHIRHTCVSEAWVIGASERPWPWRNFPLE